MSNLTLFLSLQQPQARLFALTCVSEHLRTGAEIKTIASQFSITFSAQVIQAIEQIADQPVAEQYAWLGTLAEQSIATASETLSIAA